MKRSEHELLETRKSIAAHLRRGLNIGSAIYEANGRTYRDFPKDLHLEEEFYIAKYVESDGGVLTSLREVGGSIEELKKLGYAGADIQKLLKGHSFEYIDKLRVKRENRKLLKTVQSEFCAAFDDYWKSRFSTIDGMKLSTHHGHLANSTFPLVKGMNFEDRLSAYLKQNGFSGIAADWAILDRTKLTPKDGLKIFVKDKLCLAELPKAVVLLTRFSGGIDKEFEVSHVSGTQVMLTVSYDVSPTKLHELWEQVLNSLLEVLDTVAKSNGFSSYQQWKELAGEFPKKIIKNIIHYSLLTEKQPKKKKTPQSLTFNTSVILRQAEEDLDSLTANLTKINVIARCGDYISSRDRRSLYVIKRRILTALTRAGYAQITKLCKRTKCVELAEVNLKSDKGLALVLLPLLLNKQARYKWQDDSVLRSLYRSLSERSWNRLVEDEVALEEIGAQFKRLCASYAETYDENVIWAARRAMPSGKWFQRILDESAIDSEAMAKIVEAGNDDNFLRDGFYDVYEFHLGGCVFHLPKDVVPVVLLNQYKDVPRESFPLDYRFGKDSTVECPDFMDFSLIMKSIELDWRQWSFTPKLKSRLAEVEVEKL